MLLSLLVLAACSGDVTVSVPDVTEAHAEPAAVAAAEPFEAKVVEKTWPNLGHTAEFMPTVTTQTLDLPAGPGEAAIEAALSAETIAGEFELKPGETSGIRMTATFQKGPILEVHTELDTMGAYPSTDSRWRHYDLRSGAPVGAESFTDLPGLQALLDGKFGPVREARRAKLSADAAPLIEALDGAHPGPEAWRLSDQGVMFLVNYDVPHVALAEFPEEEVLVDWAALKPFLQGPLAEIAP